MYGRTAIMYAARRGSRRCVEVLLHQGTDVTIQDNWGATVVHYAAFATNPAMLQSILNRRTDVNVKDRFGTTPLCVAVIRGSAKNVKLLLRHGADRSIQDYKGQTALMVAVLNQEAAIAQDLITADSIDISDNEGKTALQYAIEKGLTNIVEILIRGGADMRHEDYNLNTLLHCAASYGDAYILEYLIAHNSALVNTQNADGHTPLHIAALKGKQEIARFLIESAGALINAQDKKQRTPLHLAAMGNHDRIIVDIMTWLPRINGELTVDYLGNTPLHYCSLNENMDAAVELLRYGARQQLYLTNKEGKTPITILNGNCREHLMYLSLYIIYDVMELEDSTERSAGSGEPEL